LLDINLNKALMSLGWLHGWHNALFEGGHQKSYKIK